MNTTSLNDYLSSIELSNDTALTGSTNSAFKLNDLLTNDQFKDLRATIEQNTRKGHSIVFNVGERIKFPDLDHMIIKVRGFEIYDGTVRPILDIVCESSRQGFIDFPLSLLRRVFAYEDVEIEGAMTDPMQWFNDNNDLSQLAYRTMHDLQRASVLAGNEYVVSSRESLKFHKVEGNPPVRTGEFKMQSVYKFKEVAE